MMNLEQIKNQAWAIVDKLLEWGMSPQFYAQIAAIVVGYILARIFARIILNRVFLFTEEPDAETLQGPMLKVRQWIFASRGLVQPLLTVLMLAIGVEVTTAAVGTAWLVRLAQSIAVVSVLYAAINQFITHPLVRKAAIWIAIPIATLKVFGWLDETINIMDNAALSVGNIRISLFMLFKAVIAGAFFFWLGRLSNNAGKRVIHKQESIDPPTRELFAKLFEIILFLVIFVMLLQVMGLDLTALTVFGGAMGVGLGFGLQQIASNFISGIILLLERSLGIGDYIELEDGKAGVLKELNMRSSTLETFDGKEIMVPNEKFITSQFVNWTRDDPRQRYEVAFSVSYDSDLHAVKKMVEAAVGSHPRVLSDPESPDCELRGFGDSGVEFAVEFWVSGLDDG
ncbi:MAG TPA: mechanosensitive ion channel, partial [Rhizobiales bacterium]|nr:mechanosensitive ion channel [Hyphomicrobiales bacterium]